MLLHIAVDSVLTIQDLVGLAKPLVCFTHWWAMHVLHSGSEYSMQSLVAGIIFVVGTTLVHILEI